MPRYAPLLRPLIGSQGIAIYGGGDTIGERLVGKERFGQNSPVSFGKIDNLGGGGRRLGCDEASGFVDRHGGIG
jgi:hypothetical protein